MKKPCTSLPLNDDDENAVLDLSDEIICLRCYQEELWYLVAKEKLLYKQIHCLPGKLAHERVDL